MKRLRPMFSYYGSKWRLSPKYPRFNDEILIEPFAGSACYSLLYWWKKVHLYDLDETIVMLWDYLINVSEDEIMNLPILESGQEIPNYLCIEQKILLGFWAGKALTYPNKTMHKAQDPSFYGLWSEKIRLRIANQLKNIRHWSVEKKSYHDIENRDALWFVDPPYYCGGKYYKKSNIDYKFLSEWCKSRDGNVIVCENSSANWLPFEPFRKNKGMIKNTSEVVWMKSRDETIGTDKTL